MEIKRESHTHFIRLMLAGWLNVPVAIIVHFTPCCVLVDVMEVTLRTASCFPRQ